VSLSYTRNVKKETHKQGKDETIPGEREKKKIRWFYYMALHMHIKHAITKT
jgi:hypothetical protein